MYLGVEVLQLGCHLVLQFQDFPLQTDLVHLITQPKYKKNENMINIKTN